MNTQLREATIGDIGFAFELRNIPSVWTGSYTQSRENRPLRIEEHLKWWNSRHNWRTFIIQHNDKDVGILNFGQLDSWIPQVGIYLHPDMWGQGIGKEALEKGLGWLKLNNYIACHTTILDNNHRSVRLFKGLGFKKIGKAREGESWYQKRLS